MILRELALKMLQSTGEGHDGNGIETENGLSKLLEHEKIGDAFDKDLVFELKALLTEATGPNLRNDVAHGLAEVSKLLSYYAVYLWWLCLSLVVITVPWERAEPVKEDMTESPSEP